MGLAACSLMRGDIYSWHLLTCLAIGAIEAIEQIWGKDCSKSIIEGLDWII